MVNLLSFLYLAFVIIFVYSLVVDWGFNKQQIIRRTKLLIGYSILIIIVIEILDKLFCHF